MATENDGRPYAFFGHSFGALCAFETARVLRRGEETLPALLGISAAAAPQTSAFRELVGVGMAAGPEALTMITGPISEKLLRDPLLLADAYTPLLADLVAMLQYRHGHEPALQVPVAVFGGDADAVASAGQLAQWGELLAEPRTPRLFPGDHHYVVARPEPVVEELMTALRAALPSTAVRAS